MTNLAGHQTHGVDVGGVANSTRSRESDRAGSLVGGVGVGVGGEDVGDGSEHGSS